MKKFIFSLIVAGLATGALAATNYTADTLSSVDQSYDGRVIAKYFSYNSGAIQHSNDVICLAYIPQNAMITYGVIQVSALTGTNRFNVGLRGADGSGYYTGTTTNAKALFLSSINASNAVTDTFCVAANDDTNAMFELGDRPVYVTIEAPSATGVTPWPTGTVVKGFVEYIEP